jgi:hypothetical protein
MLDIYGNMHPDTIDYNLIDPPLRNLVKEINKSSWAKTIGSCAGRACHNNKGFYLIIEVKGLKGIQNLLKWMSLSHALGFKACYYEKTIKDYALSRAEIDAPNFLHNDFLPTSALMGDNTLLFRRKIFKWNSNMRGIKALELGWNVLVNKHVKKK